MTDFGLLLKTLRSNANLTQQALAHQIGIKNGAISRWERGESFPNIFAIRKLSDILNVSCDELLHPTDTLAKMNTNTSDRNPDICEAITLNEAMEDNIPAKDASPAPLPIPFFFLQRNYSSYAYQFLFLVSCLEALFLIQYIHTGQPLQNSSLL